MSFVGFTRKDVAGFVADPAIKMVADDIGLCPSYNVVSNGGGGGGGGCGAAVSVPQPVQMFHASSSHHLQPMFHSSPLSLALPKMENLGEMSLMGGSYDGGLLGRSREDEFESRSGSDNFEAASGDDLNITGNKSSKRKKYHRHTAFQIQELEAAFKENPHPDEKERLELGKRLGLEPRQVKFWFQNRRTQMKTQLERHENSILKQENDKLLMENMAMKEAMRNPICDNCGSPAILGEVPMEQHHLMIENARLKDELSRLGSLASKFLGRTNGPMPVLMGNTNLDLEVSRNGIRGLNAVDRGIPIGLEFGNRISNAFPMVSPNGPAMAMTSANAAFDKSVFVELAMVAMDELVKLAQIDSPLWFKSSEGNGQSMNLDEYVKTFSPCIGMKPSHFVTEATKATGTIIISSVALVEALMDADHWTEIFPWNIGGRAVTLEIISPGMAGNRNGALQLMQAEFQFLSPMVPVRKMKFIRFCKQHRENMWAVVDVSFDMLLPGMTGNTTMNCRRLPSGCVVQDMPNGCSKVTWIEHTEYDENIIHHLYRPLVQSGMAFGAEKWVANLQSQCELFAVIMSSMVSSVDQSALPPIAKTNIVKLAQRMTRNFCTGVCATVHSWEVVQDAENTKLMMRKSVGDSGEPHGIIMSATTSVWMAVSPQHLVEFLQNENSREHWDVLSQDGPMQQVLRIPKGQGLGNSICLLRTTASTAANVYPSSMLILQDTCTNASGSFIVHAAVDAAGMNAVMNGADPSTVAILPSGFSIVPDCLPESTRPNSSRSSTKSRCGSFLTISFQILVNRMPAAKLTSESVDTVKSLIERTLQGIKSGLQCD